MKKAPVELRHRAIHNSIDAVTSAIGAVAHPVAGRMCEPEHSASLASATASRLPSPANQLLPPCAIELDRLYLCLEKVSTESHPRTARLLSAGTRKAAQKVIEEAGELALEAVKHHRGNAVRESADLLYHLVVLWRRAGIDPGEVWSEMRRRADPGGIAEKLPKPSGCNPLLSQR
jgi:phosphoribosyl-ATP pyrophosphohydrolase